MNAKSTADTIRQIILHLNTYGSDDKSLQDLADIHNGEYWNSGGNCMLASIPLKTHFQIVVSCETACIYYNAVPRSDYDFKYLNDDGEDYPFPYITVWEYDPSNVPVERPVSFIYTGIEKFNYTNY